MLSKKIIAICIGMSISSAVFSSDKPEVKEPVKPEFSADVSETKLVSFPYSPNRVYEIQTRIGMWSVITLEDDERVTGFNLSDTTFWGRKVTNDRKRVMVRPTEQGRFNSASLITNKRTYELVFKSYGEGFPWYQRITWKFQEEADPAFGVFKGDVDLVTAGTDSSTGVLTPAGSVNSSSDESDTGWTVDVSKAHFDYQILNEGRAKFAPIRVFDDGKFTYIQMPNVQDLPALFAIDEDGSVRLVDYVVKRGYILVQRVLPGILLKLGEQEVKVMRNE